MMRLMRCDQFLERRGWQNWIFPLLVDGTMATSNGKAPASPAASASASRSFVNQKADVEGDVFKLTITLFTTLHYEALCKVYSTHVCRLFFFSGGLTHFWHGIVVVVQKKAADSHEIINPVKDTLELLFQFAGLNHETLALARVILISTMIKACPNLFLPSPSHVPLTLIVFIVFGV
jgi:hypothetical protein